MALAMEKSNLIYLYDLPKDLVTSVKIAKVIKDQSEYDLQEPVQFRDCKPHPVSGLPSPFQYGIIKVDPTQWEKVSKAIKYFNINDGDESRKWQCRALPFDRELLGSNKLNTNTQLNVFVKGIDASMDTQALDKLFSEKFGEVKSAKISLSVKPGQPPVSNGYGFVCFQKKEDLEKALKAQKIGNMEIIRYQPRDPRDIRKVYNNIYVKNFPLSWKEEQIRARFSKYGDIKSIFLMTKANKEGVEKPFAFVCFDRDGDRTYGPACAEKAVADLHDKDIEGNEGQKIYVQPAIPSDQRQAQVQREQQRFKNSKKKCNLFVKNFPNEYTEENLRELFGKFGVIESIKISKSKPEENKQFGARAFVCFQSPDSAQQARANLHQQNIDGRQLYVTNYELPEIRKKQQTEAKDRADFLTQRKLTAPPLDSNLLARPDTIQLIQQIILLIQKQMGRNFQGQGNFGGQPGYPRNNMGPRRQPYNNGPRGPAGRSPAPYNNAPMNQPAPQVIPQVVPQQAQVVIRGDAQPLAHPDPAINGYNLGGFKLIPAVVPQNPNYKNMVGEYIYEHVERIATDAYAPKITGMLIDLSIDEIKAYLYDYSKLFQKVNEAGLVLQQQAAQQQ